VGPWDPGCDDWDDRATKDLVLGRKLQGDVILGPGACPGPGGG